MVLACAKHRSVTRPESREQALPCTGTALIWHRAGRSATHDPMPRKRLSIFSAAERRYCEPLLRGFAGRHPEIDIDFVFGISTELHRRFLHEAESGGPAPDLFWSSAMDQQMSLVLEGHAQPHGLNHALPAGAAYRDLAVATTCEPLVALTRGAAKRAAMPAGTPAEIASLIESDVTRFHGRIVVPDIETNGLGFLAMLWWSEHDASFDSFLEALALCAPVAVGSAPALIAAMSEGAELALHVLGAYAERAVAADPRLGVASSAAPWPAIARVAFIPRRAANPEAASLFLAFLLSADGQAAIGEAGLFPIAAKPQRPVVPIPLDERFPRLLDRALQSSLLLRWRTALGRTQNQNRRKQS
jgi:iron(III) transport system substrate-binding protein